MSEGENQATIIVTLFVEASDLTVEQMCERIGLQCDKYWRLGSKAPSSHMLYETNSWAVEERISTSEDPQTIGDRVNDSLAGVLDRIGKHAEGFRATATGRVAGLSIAISCAEIPPLRFPSKHIEAIARLGVDLEVDLTLH